MYVYQNLVLTSRVFTYLKQAFRKAVLRWHPDKFVVRYEDLDVCILRGGGGGPLLV